MKLLLSVMLLLVGAAIFAQPKIGEQSPDIILKDFSGNDVSLFSLKGKVVLVDFWASWCGPCRKANKYLVKAYPALKSRGFEIYSISLDDDKNAWKQAVTADKITWLQVNESGGWYAPVAKQWKIDQIPTSYLLDKEGKIIARDPDERQLEKRVSKLLGQ